MDQEQFEEQLQIAQNNSRSAQQPLYWCGYARGLRRAYLGRRFSSDTDHFAWLEFRKDADPCVAELGRGYRDGLAAVVSGRATGTLRG